ncbi:alpha/beta hydrolase [Actinophytocola gossypii]|uniref:Alpha/beta hydrolase n=1 Tax=Actinophytocola gossypii TaxID=2812003 RepID=A0ABT2J3L7_9PSEU|nr:alpha/beta hydrolase [Actinophytocola gossypii]MCT2582448.1 alpha/beta hydrolase [Actinophytocola gossypii]
MSSALSRVPLSVQGAALHAVFALPQPARRLLAGPPIRRDGLELALDAQLLLRMAALTDQSLTSTTAEGARARMEAGRTLLGGPIVGGVDTRNLNLPVTDGTIPARLYEPDDLPAGSPLLVYYHGGGWVIGGLDTHDGVCRYLATHANVRVLSVGYRLAPEYPFPAAADDAYAAFRYAAANAESLGADPSAIAVGGDSAGGNLTAVVCLDAVRRGGPRPVFQLLFYPATDPSVRRRSRDLFGDGFFLTDDDMTWFIDHYCPDVSARTDPRIAVLLADDLRGLPPAYIATAGFDPLRDEGNAFADRLREAGVPVVKRQHDDLIHGFVSFLSLGSRFREAVSEAAGALRTGLALRSRANVVDLFRPTA